MIAKSSHRRWAGAAAVALVLFAAPPIHAEPGGDDDSGSPTVQVEPDVTDIPVPPDATEAQIAPDATDGTQAPQPAPAPGAPPIPPPTAPGAYVPPPGSTTVPMEDLGWSGPLSFYFNRDITTATLKFPVPPGLIPLAFTAQLELPIAISVGGITVTQEGRTIARVDPLPPSGSQVVFPLNGVKIYGNWLNVTVTMTAVPPDGFCWDTRSVIRFTGGAVTFAGTDAPPATVATFLPPILRKITIALPANPSPAESTAAVQLAAILQRRYGGFNFELLLLPLADGGPGLGPPGARERAIILRESPDKGLSVEDNGGVPTLRISGPGDELANQTRFLGDSALTSALSAKAVAGPLSTDQLFALDRMPLRLLLRRPLLTSEGLWPEVGISLDQTVFGRSMRAFHLHLIGSHTPLPDQLGGEVTVSVDGELINRWPTEADGSIDHEVDVPDWVLNRSTNVNVKVRTLGDLGHCGDYPYMVLRINGDTLIEGMTADPPVPPGFQSFPQALQPRIRVGIGPDTFADTVRATQIVMALQRSSGLPLAPVVTNIEDAANSTDPAVLIASQGWKYDAIPLPVRAEQGTVVVDGRDAAGNATSLSIDSALPLGSLQTVVDGGRSLLVATSNGNPAQLDELLRWIGAERGRWNGLDGRAVISMPGSEPVIIPNPTIDFSPRRDAYFSWSLWTIVAGVGAVALSAVGAIAILLMTRRRRSAGRHEG